MEEHDDQARVQRRRRQFFVRASIFVGLAAAAQASAALPPGPNNLVFYWASLAVFAACALSLFLPWQRFPQWAVLVPTLGYLVSVTLLLISGGTNPNVQSTAGGLSVLVLLPVLCMALYYPASYAVITVAASLVSITVAGIAVQDSDATVLRRLFLWTAVSVVVTVTIHHLRNSLETKVRDSDDLARLGRLMNDATQSLTSLRDPADVIAEGTLVMAELVGSGCSSASYVRVGDGVVIQEAVFDDRGTLPTSYLLRDDPYVGEVWDSGTPMVAQVYRTAMGPTLRAITDEVAITHSAFIPVSVNEQMHGIVRIDSSVASFPDDILARCRAMANVVELALGNAIAHQEARDAGQHRSADGAAQPPGSRALPRRRPTPSGLEHPGHGHRRSEGRQRRPWTRRRRQDPRRGGPGRLRQAAWRRPSRCGSVATNSWPWWRTPTSRTHAGWPTASRRRCRTSRCRAYGHPSASGTPAVGRMATWTGSGRWRMRRCTRQSAWSAACTPGIRDARVVTTRWQREEN